MNLFKAASTVSLLTLASRITGLVRESLIASAFGANAMTDAFRVAFLLPNLFRRWFAEGAFSQAFVPVLAATKIEQGEDATKVFIGQVATILAWAVLLLSVVGVVAAPFLVWLAASGLSGRGFDAAVVMTRWMFPYIGFMSMVALAAGVLNTWKRYAMPAVTPVLLNICFILAIWLGAPLFKSWGLEPIYATIVGVVVGGVLQLGVQLYALRRMGLFPRVGYTVRAVREAWANPATKRIAKLMMPAIFGVSVSQISLLLNTQIASHLRVGSVSWINCADRLMEFPIGMLGVALGVVLMPQLSAARAAKNAEEYSAMLDWGLRLVMLLAMPCAVGLLCFSKPLIAVMYHYNAFSAFSVEMTSMALMGYGIGLLGMVAIKVLASGFYASQDIKTPVKIAIVVLIVTQLLNMLFVPFLQHAALALSIGLGALVNAGLLLFGLMHRGSYKPEPGWGKFSIQVMFSSVLLGVFLLWAEQAVDWLAMSKSLAAHLERFGLVAVVLALSGGLYFGAVMALGLKLKQFLRR